MVRLFLQAEYPSRHPTNSVKALKDVWVSARWYCYGYGHGVLTCTTARHDISDLLSPSLTYLVILLIKLSTVGSRAFPVAAAQVWNGLPEAVISSSSLQSFRRQPKTHLFELSYPHLVIWLLIRHRYSGPCSNIVIWATLKIYVYLLTYLRAGAEGEHEADVPAHPRRTVQSLPQAGQVQEAAVLSVLLPLGTHRTSQVPDAWLEHPVRLQRLRLRGESERHFSLSSTVPSLTDYHQKL